MLCPVSAQEVEPKAPPITTLYYYKTATIVVILLESELRAMKQTTPVKRQLHTRENRQSLQVQQILALAL